MPAYSSALVVSAEIDRSVSTSALIVRLPFRSAET